MDIFGGTVTIVTETYNISLFIRAFITDVRTYGSATREIQEKLEHELLFLESFKYLFFEKEGALSRYEDLPAILTHDVSNILRALRKSLAEYGLLASKHGLVLAESRVHPIPGQTSTNEVLPNGGFRSHLRLKMKELKKKVAPVDWALFDKDKINKVLAEYGEGTTRLRQLMELMLLTLAAFGGISRRDLVQTKDAVNLRLQRAARMQLRVESLPPVDFGALSGQLAEMPSHGDDSALWMTEYMDPNGFENTRVIVEIRKYSEALAVATEDENEGAIKTFKEPIRNLAWLLGGSSSINDADQYESSMSTLHCIGFLDQPDQYRSILLYEVPESIPSETKVQTLHQLVNDTDANEMPSFKPGLGDRFLLAHTLASTVLGLHSSGWVHKNIWSRGILMIPSPTMHMSAVPYLVGWGLARRLEASTELKGDLMLEPNIYRHPSRYKEPRTPYVNSHDIYALGVVLLEIGIWQTVSHIFAGAIQKSRLRGELPPVMLKHKKLLEMARSRKLKQEMGERYARAIERCLSGDFEVDSNDEKEIALSTKFRELVVEELAYGTKL